MRSIFQSKVTWLIGLLVAAVLSFFCIAPHMTQPSTYQNSLNTLQGKQETVLELTAVSAAASTAITVLPGDVATPIADKLADLSWLFSNSFFAAIFLENVSTHHYSKCDILVTYSPLLRFMLLHIFFPPSDLW